jgi:hypothetical protein
VGVVIAANMAARARSPSSAGNPRGRRRRSGRKDN